MFTYKTKYEVWYWPKENLITLWSKDVWFQCVINGALKTGTFYSAVDYGFYADDYGFYEERLMSGFVSGCKPKDFDMVYLSDL